MPPETKSLPRVLFLIGSLEPGGSEGQLVALLERSHGRRIDAGLALISRAVDTRHTTTIERLGIPYVVLSEDSWRLRRWTVSARKLTGLLRSWRPDLVYPWLEESTLLAAPIARLMGVPVLVARRNISGGYATRPRYIVSAIHAADRLAVLTTANSHAVAAESLRRGVKANRIRVIPNGHVMPDGLPPVIRRDAVTLGCLARMRAEKGHRRLVRAVAGLTTDVPWLLKLGGDGPLQAEIEAEVRRHGLQDQVAFLGPVEDAAEFWRRCDVAVLFSDHEGSPNALIEAAAAGVPMVATAVGGVLELVDDANGLLVDPGDDAAATMALRRLIEDPDLRARLGAAAQQRVRASYSMEAFVEGHCAAIDEALALRGR